MPKVLIKREGGVTIEADLSFDQLKELAGLNGHRVPPAGDVSSRVSLDPSTFVDETETFRAFFKSVSDRGRKFLVVLQDHPEGIEASALATAIGFANAKQIGGLAGGGLAKVAGRYRINLGDVYRTEVTFPDANRTRMYYPGKSLLELLEH